MIELDPTLPLRLAQHHDPASGRSLTSRAIGGLAVGLGGLLIGTVGAGTALYCLGAAIVEHGLWPL